MLVAAVSARFTIIRECKNAPFRQPKRPSIGMRARAPNSICYVSSALGCFFGRLITSPVIRMPRSLQSHLLPQAPHSTAPAA